MGGVKWRSRLSAEKEVNAAESSANRPADLRCKHCSQSIGPDAKIVLHPVEVVNEEVLQKYELCLREIDSMRESVTFHQQRRETLEDMTAKIFMRMRQDGVDVDKYFAGR